MRLETSRFGTLDIDDARVITFTQPIIGFQEFRRFVLLDNPDNGAVRWLQSAESGDLAFIVIDPRVLISDYTVQVGKHELTELAVDNVDELEVFTLLVVPPDRTKIRTNLKAPILINPRHRLAKQAILEACDYPVQYFLPQAANDAGTKREISNARTNP